MSLPVLPPLTGSALFDPWRIRYREQLAGRGPAATPRRPTRSEVMLWEALQSSPHEWVAEHPTRYGYRLDFYCAAARLAVEVDGSSHWGQYKAERDAWRDTVHERMGIRTKRFSAREVEDELDWVTRGVDELVQVRLQELAGQRPAPPPLTAGPPRPGARPKQEVAAAPTSDATGTAVEPVTDEGLSVTDAEVNPDELTARDAERLLAFPPDPAGWSALLPACRTVLPELPDQRSLLRLLPVTARLRRS